MGVTLEERVAYIEQLLGIKRCYFCNQLITDYDVWPFTKPHQCPEEADDAEG